VLVRRKHFGDREAVRAVHRAAFAEEGSEAEPVEAGLVDSPP
jgi:hypothetical protein